MKKWAPKGSTIYITEGEFDAMSLNECAYYGCALGGKSMSQQQIQLIRNYKPVIALDNDQAGLLSIINIGNTLLRAGFTEIRYIRPPKGYKDWNAFLQKHTPKTIQGYIEKYTKSYTQWTEDQLLSFSL